MLKEKFRSPKVARPIFSQEPSRVAPGATKIDRSTVSSRFKIVAAKGSPSPGKHWWEKPEFSHFFIECERNPPCKDCQQHNGHQLRLLKVRRKFPPFKHVLNDFAHRYAKLKLPSDEQPDAQRTLSKNFRPGPKYYGIQGSDVTASINKPPPRHGSLDPDAPTEWFGLKSFDITRDMACKGPRPFSREHFYGIQGTDVTQNTRNVIPSSPSANGELPEFFGRPKSDVTNFDVLPKRIANG